MVGMPMSSENFDKKVEDFFKNYHDRGMVKWAGFYLSDHVLKMHKKSKADAYVEIKKVEMSLNEISKILLKAYAESRVVEVQLYFLNQEGELPKRFKGRVLGVDGDKVMVGKEIIDINDINHVEVV